jgi:GNAT superfamily N-acetyltransferase
VTSPILDTEAFAMPSDTTFTSIGDLRVADTPACRASYYGHRIVLSRAPGEDDWLAHYRQWSACHEGKLVDVAYLVWEVEEPAAEAPEHPPGVAIAVSRGLRLDRLPTPAVVPTEFALRPLVSDAEWESLFDLAVAVHPFASDDSGKDYLRWDHAGRRKRVEVAGRQWGAFVDDRLVGAAALLPGEGCARYQDVFVHPDYRRQGLASALVSRAASQYQARAPGTPMWIAAEANSPAEALYRRLGFEGGSTVFEASIPAPPTAESIARRLRDLENGTLELRSWGHKDHLHVALAMLRAADMNQDVAMDRMRSALKGFLEVLGVETTPEQGYHETLTRGFMIVLRDLARRFADESLADLALRAGLDLGDKRYLLHYWSRDRMMSSEARYGWVEPDLYPLPF